MEYVVNKIENRKFFLRNISRYNLCKHLRIEYTIFLKNFLINVGRKNNYKRYCFVHDTSSFDSMKYASCIHICNLY